MSFIKDSSVVNNIMFAPPNPSYTQDLGVGWVSNVCCLFLQYNKKGRVTTLAENSILETHPVIIVCHGNACDIGEMKNFCVDLSSRCKSHVILYEYPGYGLSNGTPSENSCTQGIYDIIDHLNNNMRVPVSNMIFYGQSIGSGIATIGYKYCKTTYGLSPAGLILISPYLSINSLKNDIVSPMVPILERFDTKENIKHCDTALLIIHGAKDTLISANHGIKLHEIATCPINIIDVVKGASHNTIPGGQILNNCELFLENIFPNVYYKIKYINRMGWIMPEITNNKPHLVTKIVSTSLETTAATSSNVCGSSSSCVLF